MEIFIGIFTAVMIIFTLLSLMPFDNWMFRVFDYPRLQKLVLSLVCLVFIVVWFKQTAFFYAVAVLISVNILYIAYLIFPFTFLSKKQVLKVKNVDEEKAISVMVTNVYQDNYNCSGCLDVIYSANPDIIVMLETNAYWEEKTRPLEDKYPYNVKVPLENTYGMLLYSKKELVEPEVKYLVEDDIPSIHTLIKFGNDMKIRLFALHPTPPVPGENPRSTERDKELLLVADMAKKSKEPVIVFGDLNDVAWSYTTKLFLKMSGLLDPRRGRGFYNTFNAHYFFLRFPLDHTFISKYFKLVSMKRFKNFNSDHFPIYIKLQYDHNAVYEQESLEKDADDVALANEKKAKA